MDVASILQFLTRDVAPPAQPLVDYSLSSDSDSDTVLLGHWADRLGPRPTEADLEAAAASPEYAAWVLQQAQDARAADIDARTAELQAAGFEFPPGSGQRFDLTPTTQAVWVSLMVGAGAGLLQYPVNAGVIGDGTYELADASAVATFCGHALNRGRAIIEGGAALKKLIYAAATVEAVAAVADTRE